MIVAALADRHPRDAVIRTLVCLAVIGQATEAGAKHALAPAEGAGLG